MDDLRESNRARGGATDDPRLLTEHDLPWLVDLCKRRYSNRYDSMTAEGWFRNIVLRAPLIFQPVRLSDAFIIASVNAIPWLPGELEANCIMLCAEEGAMWQALRLLRFSIEWARKRRCVEYRISSETGIDIAALAMRVGATELSPRYCIRLTDG